MKAFTAIGIFAAVAICIAGIQTWRLDLAKAEISFLTAELDVAKTTQRADRETFSQQIKLIREAANNAGKAHKFVTDQAALSDADWLATVVGGMWRKDTNSGGVPASVDAGAMQGTGSGDGTATGHNPAAVQRSHDAQGN